MILISLQAFHNHIVYCFHWRRRLLGKLALEGTYLRTALMKKEPATYAKICGEADATPEEISR